MTISRIEREREPMRGPYCAVPKCIEPAEAAVLFAYVKETRRYLCTEHIKPVRAILVELLHADPLAATARPSDTA
jgi:hypothetical protein